MGSKQNGSDKSCQVLKILKQDILSVKNYTAKMEGLINSIAKYLDILKDDIVDVLGESGAAYKIEQQIFIISHSFMVLKEEMTSVDTSTSDMELNADTLSEYLITDLTRQSEIDNAEVESNPKLPKLVKQEPLFLEGVKEAKLSAVSNDQLKSNKDDNVDGVGLSDASSEDDHNDNDDNSLEEKELNENQFQDGIQNDDENELLNDKNIGKSINYDGDENKALGSDHKENKFDQNQGNAKTFGGSKECSCIVCGRTCFSVQDLQIHLKLHIDVDALNCENCEQVFSTHDELSEHAENCPNKLTKTKLSRKIRKKNSKFSSAAKGVFESSRTETDNPFDCQICFMKFDDGKSLKGHTKTHRVGTNEYKCDECGKVVANKFLLIEHTRIHTGEKPYECQECGKCFYRKSSFDCHKLVHCEEVFRCKFCTKRFDTSYKLEKHVERNHSVESVQSEDNPDQPSVKCEICNKTFRNNHHLKIHTKIHTIGKPFQCQDCEKVFPNKRLLQNHSKRHTGERPFECQECGKRFFEKSHLNEHMNIHNGVRFPCEVCGKLFYTQSLRRMHYKREHTGEPIMKPHICDQCGIGCRSKQELSLHTMRKHTGEKPFKCEHCTMTFLTNFALRNHTRTHFGDKPYQCEECGMRFYKRSSLNRHSKIHTGKGLHKCEQCGKGYPVAAELRNHMRTHTGEKRYQCTKCGKSFFQSSHLNDHMFTHFTHKQFRCEVCGKEFTRGSGLKDHMKIHTGKDLATCLDCGKSYISHQQLKRHRTKNHSGQQKSLQLPTHWGHDVQMQQEEVTSGLLAVPKDESQNQIIQYVSVEEEVAHSISASVNEPLPNPQNIIYVQYDY